MDEALRSSLPPGCVYYTPKGGIFFWIRLPDSLDCADLQKRCNVHRVDFAPGPLFSADGRGGNYVRLNFTLLDEDDIRAGVERFADEATTLVNGPSRKSAKS